jgi:dipeptidyl-peptidase-4
MKKISFLLFLCVFSVGAQQKEITLEDIWQGTFRGESMNSLNSMKGNYYSLLNYNRSTGKTSVDQYNYKTLEKVKTIVDSEELSLDGFSSYSFDENESKILLGTEIQSIYRRSTKGVFYVYELESKKLQKIDEQKIQEPTFSPDGSRVAFVKNNNLFVKDLESNALYQITTDGAFNQIINGIADWVYEEEFSIVRLFQWNNDGSKLAFLRFDEADVPEFSMDIYGNGLYPSQQEFKYPKAGESNSKVSLWLHDFKKKSTNSIALGDYEYIPRLQFSNKTSELIVTTLNRHQNDLKLWSIDTESFESKIILEEQDSAYVDINDNLTFLEDDSFIWTSEKSGFNHIYHYKEDGELINQVTTGDWEVTNYYGYDPKSKQIFYQSVENGSINRGIYSIKLNGKSKKALSSLSGTNSASFSSNLKYFINTYSDAQTPNIYSLRDQNGRELKVILENTKLQNLYNSFEVSPKEFFTLKTKESELNAWIIKPLDFDPNKTYPVFMTQYSGPGSQSVSNSWGGSNDYWYQMLAQKGIIVVCVDGRGTGLKGADFKKMTYKELGKYEVEDQIEAAQILGERSYIDANRIGIFGWSYGGFMSSNCLLQGNEVFSMAIAVAPVTSWRFYDSVYTERYMQTPQENPTGYDQNSPITHASKLKGKYLLIHGTGDDNVHVQNTMQMVNALVKYNKQFDLMIYPDRAHGIYRGQNTRLQLYTKMTNFIEQNLKPE